MGFRTLVVLNNDFTGNWSKDPTLGEQIARAMNHAMGATPAEAARLDGGYGRVLSCEHADVQKLAVISHFQLQTLASTHWSSGQQDDQMQFRLLKDAAEKLGFKLVKGK